LRLFSFGGYGLALAALALVFFLRYRMPPLWNQTTGSGLPERIGLYEEIKSTIWCGFRAKTDKKQK